MNPDVFILILLLVSIFGLVFSGTESRITERAATIVFAGVVIIGIGGLLDALA